MVPSILSTPSDGTSVEDVQLSTSAVEMPSVVISTLATDTVIKRSLCPMARLEERIKKYRDAKNAPRAQLSLGPVIPN